MTWTSLSSGQQAPARPSSHTVIDLQGGFGDGGQPRNAEWLPPKPSSKIDMCSELVGMAGFEPAASCSQNRPEPSPDVARHSQKRLLAAVIAARRRPMVPCIGRHWLPLLAPP